MKKIYIAPVTDVLQIHIEHHLCETSEIKKGGEYSGGSIESRRGTFWGDDDE